MEFHEAANIFPLDEENIDALAADIKANGQLFEIQIFHGKIIDGRRRWLACQKAGVQPKMVNVSPPDPIAHVLSINLHRRHLTPSQLAMVGARAREWYDRQAKERQKCGKGGKLLPANLPEASKGDARDQVGKTVGVSGKSIDYATKVLKEATPEVVKAVDEGRMAVSTAAILASEPEDKQREEATNPRRNRDYKSVTRPRTQPEGADEEEPEDSDETGRESRGVGVRLANEALNSLRRIPKNDALRERGFQIVTDWIRRNK